LAAEIQRQVVDVKATREGFGNQAFVKLDSLTAAPPRCAHRRVMRWIGLAAVLGNRAESLRIEGHTDNVPIHNLRIRFQLGAFDFAGRRTAFACL